MKYFFLLIIIVSLTAITSFAQDNKTVTRESIADIYDDIIDNEDMNNDAIDNDNTSDETYRYNFELLSEYAETKRNINEQTLDDLLAVPLISEQQAKAILNYRALYGDLRNIAELTLITSIDPEHRKLLQSLFYAVPVKKQQISPWKTLFKYPKQRLLTSINLPLYSRKGFSTPISEGGYHGYRWGNTIRYHLANKHLMIAFTAAQDPGEPFFSGTNRKGWDYYTGYIRLKDMGILKNIIIGDYRPSAGMGLIMSGNYRASKTSMLMGPPSTIFTITGNSSRSSNNFLRGIAVTLNPIKGKLTHLSFSLFASHKSIDASLNNDSTIKTIQTSGYHRTDKEISYRNAAKETVFGGNITFSMLPKQPLRFGLNYIHIGYSELLMPSNTQKYNWYKPQGRDFENASLTYSLTLPKISIEGETAISSKANYNDNASFSSPAIATANTIRWSASNTWSLFALQRFYSYRFISIKGYSFGDVTNTQNESGIYAGLQTTALRNFTISAYTDFAYHPWWRYSHAADYKSWDTYISTIYEKQRWMVSLRYRFRDYIDDYRLYADGTKKDISNQHTLRLKVRYAGAHWVHTTQAQGTLLGTDNGWLVSHAIGYVQKKLSLSVQLSYYDTSDYQTRLYMQRPALLYGSSVVTVYGRGIYGTVVGKIRVNKNLDISLLSTTNHFFDRSSISSGMQLIESSTQSDLTLQAALKF